MDRFDEALQRRAAKNKADGGSNIGKIIAALESNSNASIKCDAKDSAALQSALANLNDEQRRNVRISKSDGFISVDIVATPQKETDTDKKNGQNDTSAAEEKMDDRLDKDSKKKNKKAKKDSKRQKKADNIKNQVSERVNKFDNAVDKAANTPNARQTGKALEKKGGKALRKAAGKGVEKAAGKAAAKTTAKIAGKATLKSILKKIPVVSLAAGCFFGYQRLKEGDWKGALGEVASGTLGCFPGIGTAASVAVDAGLAVRDIHQATHPVQADGRKIPAVVPQELRAEINQRGIPQKQRSQHTPSSLSAEQAAFLHQQNAGRC